MLADAAWDQLVSIISKNHWSTHQSSPAQSSWTFGKYPEQELLWRKNNHPQQHLDHRTSRVPPQVDLQIRRQSFSMRSSPHDGADNTYVSCSNIDKYLCPVCPFSCGNSDVHTSFGSWRQQVIFPSSPLCSTCRALGRGQQMEEDQENLRI